MSHRQHGETEAQAQARALKIMAYWRAQGKQVNAWPKPVPGMERYWTVASDMVNGEPKDPRA